MCKHTRTEWKRCETTLGTSGEDAAGWTNLTDQTSKCDKEVIDCVGQWINGKCGANCQMVFYTRFECIFASFPPVSSVFFNLLHSFRVYFKTQTWRIKRQKKGLGNDCPNAEGATKDTECSWGRSSPLVSSVV